jgi:hypothetical protein
MTCFLFKSLHCIKKIPQLVHFLRKDTPLLHACNFLQQARDAFLQDDLFQIVKKIHEKILRLNNKYFILKVILFIDLPLHLNYAK